MAPTLAEMRDSAVLREGRLWPEQVRRAAGQPPSRLTTARTEKLLAGWRAEIDPHDLGVFEMRLERDGLTQATAATVFSAPDQAQRGIPSWWPHFRRIVEALEQADAASVAAHLAADPELRDTVPFVDLLIPMSATEVARLTSELDPPLADGVRRDLHRDLVSRLSQVAAPCLNEVFWQDQPFGTRFLAQAGASPEADSSVRYVEYCDFHRHGGLAHILLDYPVLGRLLATVVDQWFDSASTMLTRVARDRGTLAEVFGIATAAELTGVGMAAGDRHNHGNAVSLLVFGDRTVVYKPRSVALEQFYAEAVCELSRNSEGSPLAAPDVLDCSDDGGDYGYVDFVERRTCDTASWPTFYRNAGRLLALLHVLMATDGHHENLIAAGDQLVLIDAETLLCGPPPDPATQPTRVESGDAPEPGSILRVGMLPTWTWLDGRRRAIDVSALGVPGSQAEQRGRGWLNVNTDAMVHGQVTLTPPQPTSLPGGPGEPNRIVEFVDDVVAGFTDASRVLLDGRGTWLADVLTRAEAAHNRAVLRPTYVYATLLGQLVEPSALRSMAASAMICEQLTRAFLNATAAEQWPLVAAEQEALARLDVPYFTWPLSGSGTHWCDGVLTGWPENDQLAQVRAHIRGLDLDDIERQAALIRGSIRASGFRMDRQSAAAEATDRAAIEAPPEMARRSFSEVAEAVLRSHGQASWMGSSLLPDGIHTNVTLIGPGLYDGRIGLALGWWLWAQSDPEQAGRAEALCSQALEPLLAGLGDADGAHRLMLAGGTGLSGVGGMLRGLGFLRRSGFDAAAAGADAERSLVDYLTSTIVRNDERTDVIGGPAGLIAPLIRLLGDGDSIGVSSAHVLDLIAACAEVLVHRQDLESGGWRTLRNAPPLTGFAHGASGIALALAEASDALGEASWLEVSVRGLAYEASLFDEVAGNWPDLRPDPMPPTDAGPSGQPRFMMGWCAGAPGIALARLRLLQVLPDYDEAPRWREEMYRAADTTATAPLATRDHICCGNLGRVAILRTLADGLGESRWDEDIDRIVHRVLAAAGTGLPRSVLGETIEGMPEPGLFTGLPGMGAVLLSSSDWVPQLLL